MTTSTSTALVLAAREYDSINESRRQVGSSLYHNFKRADNEFIDFVVWMLGNKAQAVAMEAVGLIDQESPECVLVLKHERLTEILGGNDAVVHQLLSNRNFQSPAFLSVLNARELASIAYNEPLVLPYLAKISESLGKTMSAGIFLRESGDSDYLSFKEIAEWSETRFIVVAMLMDRDNMEDDVGDWMGALRALTPKPGDDPDGSLYRSAGITLLRDICRRRLQEAVRRDSPFK